MPKRNFSLWLFLLCLFSVVHADILDLNEMEETDNQPYRSLPFFRVSGDYGMGLHLGGNDSGATKEGQDFNKKTRLGGAYYLDAQVYPWPKGGLGIFYSSYSSDDQALGIRMYPADPAPYDVTKKISLRLYGPIFSSRVRAGPVLILGGVGAGPLQWRETDTYGNFRYEIEGDTYGILGQIGCDLPVIRALSLGVNIRLILASLKKYKVNGETFQIEDDPDNHIIYYHSLNRLEITAGLRFGL